MIHVFVCACLSWPRLCIVSQPEMHVCVCVCAGIDTAWSHSETSVCAGVSCALNHSDACGDAKVQPEH